MKRIIFSALVCVSAGTASAANEVVKSTLQVNAIKLEVTDLTPDDGIAAGVTPYSPMPGISEPSSNLRLGRSTYLSSEGIDETISGSTFDPIQFNRSNETGYLIKNDSGISLGVSLDHTTANQFLNELVVGYSIDQYQIGVSSVTPSNWLGLTIAPHTALHLSADLTQTVEMDLPLIIDSPQWQTFDTAGHRLELTAISGASMTIWDQENELDVPPQINDANYLFSISVLTDTGYLLRDDNATQTATIQLNFANDSDHEVIRYVELDAMTGYSLVVPGVQAPIEPEVPAIPEPGSAALMGLGLFGLATVVRRSRPMV